MPKTPDERSAASVAADAAPKLPGALRAVVGIGVLEAAALAAYAAAILVASFNSYGATNSSSRIEALLYLIFGALVGLVAYGLNRRRALARTPFLVVQVFGLVVAYPLLRSGSAVPVAVGAVIAAVSVVGFVMALRPAVAEALSD